MNSDTPTPPAPAGLHETTLDLVNEAAIRTIHASPLFERKLAAHLAAVDAKLKECEEEKGEVLRKHAISSLEALTYFHEKHETEQQRDRLQRENEELRKVRDLFIAWDNNPCRIESADLLDNVRQAALSAGRERP